MAQTIHQETGYQILHQLVAKETILHLLLAHRYSILLLRYFECQSTRQFINKHFLNSVLEITWCVKKVKMKVT